MRLVSFEVSTRIGVFRRIGASLDQELTAVADLTSAYTDLLRQRGELQARELAATALPPDMMGFLKGGPCAMLRAAEALAHVKEKHAAEPGVSGPHGEQLIFSTADIRLLAPLPQPLTMRNFFVYEAHMSTVSAKDDAWYRWPLYYKGMPTSFIGPGEDIPWPHWTDRLDLEPELGIVLYANGRDLRPEQVAPLVAGYTIFVDCSARDGYKRERFGPTKRKDWCNVMGPCLVTPDEVDIDHLPVRTWVDGELWFEGNVGEGRQFTPEQVLAFCADGETLHPGEFIALGTVGLGCSMDLNRWIRPGQVFEVEFEGVGRMRHRVVRRPSTVSYVREGMQGAKPGPQA